ncbi:predicted protein [Lichtheimia corymbifera JMRC:FSU:9682]|uniref:Uncharacterized protein n=1 Tax=Lichtheimia corymbifera JMRC:FSU:9682 TaxID=1263082 RepID=A0A068RPJ5_9FUNG|nr:predicted protein [Lichtheimia corymbifera JMRC:FSU:9682]
MHVKTSAVAMVIRRSCSFLCRSTLGETDSKIRSQRSVRSNPTTTKFFMYMKKLLDRPFCWKNMVIKRIKWDLRELVFLSVVFGRVGVFFCLGDVGDSTTKIRYFSLPIRCLMNPVARWYPKGGVYTIPIDGCCVAVERIYGNAKSHSEWHAFISIGYPRHQHVAYDVPTTDLKQDGILTLCTEIYNTGLIQGLQNQINALASAIS